jgi:hypothetical protein
MKISKIYRPFGLERLCNGLILLGHTQGSLGTIRAVSVCQVRDMMVVMLTWRMEDLL